MGTPNEKLISTEWLFPMTLNREFDELFKVWAATLREAASQGNGWLQDETVSKVVIRLASQFFASASNDHAVEVWAEMKRCSDGPYLSDHIFFSDERAHDFAHQVHRECVKRYRLTRDKRVIEDKIQQGITGTGHRYIDDRFKASGFVSSLAELIYQNVDQIGDGPNYLGFRVTGLVRKMDDSILRAGFNVRSFQESTGEILAQAHFMQNKADTIEPEEARDFARKIHKVFVMALTPA